MRDEDKTPPSGTRVHRPTDGIIVYDGTVITSRTDLSTMASSVRLTQHFTYDEMVRSQTAARRGIDNTPTFEQLDAGVEFASRLLEPLRRWAGPVYPSSWFRCKRLNAAIGGSKTSAHMECVALDHTTQKSLREEMEWWVSGNLPFDQVIYEFGRWIHIGGPKPGNQPRRQALMIFRGTGYLLYDPSKIDSSGTQLKGSSNGINAGAG